MHIDSLDHLVLTVRDLEAAIDFYTRALGMTEVTFGAGRKALAFGPQKINLHQAGREFEPKADRPTPGSADLCFLTRTPVEQYAQHLAAVVDLPSRPRREPDRDRQPTGMPWLNPCASSSPARPAGPAPRSRAAWR